MLSSLLLLCQAPWECEALAAPAPHPDAAVALAGDGPALFNEARSLLSAGKLDEAAAKVLEGLSFEPWSTTGYEILYDIAERGQDEEARLRWGKWLYWSHDYSGRAKEAAGTAAALAALWDGWNKDGQIVGGWREAVVKAARNAAGSRQYRVSGHLMSKLLDLDPVDAELSKEYDKLYEKAGEMLSGGAFVAERVRRRSPAWVERQNRLHENWESAFKRRTSNYEVVTNVSYEFFETLSVVMEDMHRFYRQVYGYNKTTPRLTLAVYKKRSDFDKFCQESLGQSLPLGVLGWFWDQIMTVAAYDPSETGTDLTDLWGTLFHEASHQFMHLYTKSTKQDPPTWLNEGTASYFEGCELKADGSIVKNKPAKSRVIEWQFIEGGANRHSLSDLITCPHRAYDGSYYSYGWSLVYFLNNYENKDGQFIYREPYLKYLHSYTRKSEEDALTRAKRMFVEEVRDPDVPDWDAFEERWRSFTRNIVTEVSSGPEFATTLQERAQKYLDRGDFERAMITAEQADDKRPRDGATYLLLAQATHDLGRKEDAAFWMLRHWEMSLLEGQEDLAAAAEDWLNRNEAKDLVELYCKPTRAALVQTERAMEDAISAGHPVMAMLFAAHMLQALGLEHRGLLARIAELGELSGHDLRLWRRAYNKSPESNRKIGGVDWVKFEPDGVLVNNPKDNWRDTRLPCEEPGLVRLEPPFDLKSTVQLDGSGGAWILLGLTATGLEQVSLRLENGATLRFTVTEEMAREDLGGRRAYRREEVAELRTTPMEKFPLSFTMKPDGSGEVSLGEQFKMSLPQEWTREKLTGGLAVDAGDNTVALFSDLLVRPHRPFWPVPPAKE